MPRTPILNELSVELPAVGGTLSQRLAISLIRSIAVGALHEGQPLPSTRSLAVQLGLSRSVVVAAYDELVASGFLEARTGACTVVAPGATHAAAADARATPLSSAASEGCSGLSGTPAVVMAHASPAPTVRFDLMPGYPDSQLINRRDWRRATRAAAESALSVPANEVVVPHFQRVHGQFSSLQDMIADHVRIRRNIVCDPRDIFFFPSVGSALDTLARVLELNGRVVGIEDPGYLRARHAMIRIGATVRSIEVDEDGVRTDRLPDDGAAVYVTPAHQFPTGARLSVRRRAELLDWASNRNAYVFEDDYDGEFRYDVPPMQTLHGTPVGAQHVIYLGTASKALTRDLRVAWAIAPSHLRAVLQQALVEAGDSVSALAALTLAEFLRSGAMTRHTLRAMRTYQARRRRFVEAVERHLPDARLLGINAGLHTVLAFDHLDEGEVVGRLAARGLACTSLNQYTSTVGLRDRLHGLVCGYSRLPETQAMDAARLIGATVREVQGAPTDNDDRLRVKSTH
jgi:GntR family transcriptional regulator/MocR family aminotransferase